MSPELAISRDLLADIKTRVRQAQSRAALSANLEMLLLYWDLGRLIAARRSAEGWGAGVLPRLAVELKNELPEEKGFSHRNLKLMVQFYEEYPDVFSIGQQAVAQLPDAALAPEIGQRAVAQLDPQAAPRSEHSHKADILRKAISRLSWAHNVILFQKLKNLPTRIWYARETLEQGWSRDTLIVQMKNRAHERAGAAVSNFYRTLPKTHASLAQGLLKDPYLFDFLTLEEPFHERELETGLLDHIQKFLLELGQGFAFVGRQYRLDVSDREFYLDLLFYHPRTAVSSGSASGSEKRERKPLLIFLPELFILSP